MTEKKYVGRTLEEAIGSAEADIGVSRDALKIDIVEEKEKGILGLKWGKKVCITAEKKQRSIIGKNNDRIKGILEKLLDLSLLKGEVEIKETFDELISEVKFDNDDESLFIGRNGKNLDAYQYVLNKIVEKQLNGAEKRIIVDSAGYRDRKRKKLEDMARKAAYKVKSENKPYTFPPMQAGERRIIHMTMKEEGLSTESRGRGDIKKVVVHPSSHI